MFKALNKKPIRNSIISAIILVMLAGVLLVMSDFGIFTVLRGAQPIGNYSLDELQGKYVEMEVNFVWEPYCYVGDTEETATEIQYMVATQKLETMDDFETADYIGVAISKSKFDEMDALYKRGILAFNSTWDVADLGQTVTFRGVVDAMDSQETSFYRELLRETDMDTCSYAMLILRDGTTPAGNPAAVWLFTLGALALVAIAVVKLVKAFTGAYQKDIRAYCAATADPEGTQARLEEFYTGTAPLPGDIRADSEHVMFCEGNHARILNTNEVLWVYTSAVRHRTNGIPTGTTYSLIMADANGKRHSISMNNEADAMNATQGLFPLLTQAVFGYDAQREKMFKKDRAAFAAIAQAQHAPQPVEEAPAQPQA